MNIGRVGMWLWVVALYVFADPRIAAAQLAGLANGPPEPYAQPVKIVAPEGAAIAFWDGGTFQPAGETTTTLNLAVGAVYRFKISRIPRHEEAEVFPSIELLSRLHPPQQRVADFPVIVSIPDDDLTQALYGHLVTRVVYLENPKTATPFRQSANDQPYFDVFNEGDPLAAAARLGRPFAVVRLGSRIPTAEEMRAGMYGLHLGTSHQPNLSYPSPAQCGLDEYIYDGGDRDAKTVVRAGWELAGLDSEDTIAHFDTLDGRRIVRESNRVQIYAPRFAAVRHVGGAVASNAIDAPLSAREDTLQLTQGHMEQTSTTLQQLQPRRMIRADVVTSFRDRTRGVTADNVARASGFSNVFQAYEDFQFIRSGQVENSEKARLGMRIDAARAWNGDLRVQVVHGQVKPLVVRDLQVVEETRVDGRASRPTLRLVKVASTSYARPGEEVEFTIRFDNVGNEEIGNVTIVDNLTARLEYVADSSQCSVPSQFKTERNESDSAVLRWEITDPLPAGNGGVIRFKCTVR